MTTPRYGHGPVKMRRVADEYSIDQVGDFAWEVGESGERFILLAVPRPRPKQADGWIFNRLPVKNGPNEKGKHWGWDGNEDAPTLTPSIHAIGHWHGWIKAGEMLEA